MFRRILSVIALIALLFTAYLWVKAIGSHGTLEKRVQSVQGNAIEANLQRIAFGSCNRQDKSQAYWEVIGRHRPTHWLWLGDNIYGDSPDKAVLEEKYQLQKNAPEYHAFRQKTKVLGTWDDHDYGSNDAGKEWTLKDEAAELLLNFLDVPENAPVRSYPGVYQSYLLGDVGSQVKVILLDTRYFRDALMPNKEGAQRYQINQDGDVLGEAQWQWLEEELTNSPAQIHLIGSSIQVIAEEQGFEKWANFPRARKRFFDLLVKTAAKNVVLLSGDRHIGEIARFAADEEHGYFEVTSSGLTHSYESVSEKNRYRVGPVTGQKNYGLLTINWAEAEPSLLFQLRSTKDDKVLNKVVIGPAATLLPQAIADLFTSPTDMPISLKPCPSSPNCVSTQSAQANKKMEPLSYSGDPATALTKLKELSGTFSRTKLVEENDHYLHFEFTTQPIPFIDDVEFLLDKETQQIHFRSASRVGYSDLGVNAKRMKKIAQAWGRIDQEEN
ncbi:MAG: DUF1499 domain-containing protein [Bacteroidota bacterium]